MEPQRMNAKSVDATRAALKDVRCGIPFGRVFPGHLIDGVPVVSRTEYSDAACDWQRISQMSRRELFVRSDCRRALTICTRRFSSVAYRTAARTGYSTSGRMQVKGSTCALISASTSRPLRDSGSQRSYFERNSE